MLSSRMPWWFRKKPAAAGGGGGGGWAPTDLANLLAWWKMSTGVTESLGTATAWADQTANGYDLTSIGATAPDYDGATLTFDGSLEAMATTGWATLESQPNYFFMAMNPVSWSSLDRIFDSYNGGSGNQQYCRQATATPDVYARNQLTIGPLSLTLGSWCALCVGFNGTSSFLQRGSAGTPVTGSAGTTGFTGVTLAASPTGAAYANIQVREMFVCGSGSALTAQEITSALEYLEGLLP